MLRDLRIFSRNPAKIPPAEDRDENLPVDPPEFFRAPPDSDPSRPPLNTIQDPLLTPKPGSDQEPIVRRKIGRTPSKKQIRPPGMPPSFPTLEKPATVRGKFGWAPKSEAGMNSADNGDDPSQHGTFHLPPPGRGGCSSTTPRTNWMGGKASSVRSDFSSTQITPTKSVAKPTYFGFSSNRPPLVIGSRIASFSAASKGMPMSSTPPTTVNVAAVPHFELKEDPSFWLDHNVQVVIRVRPLNSMEQSLQGHNRCLKQESANNVTWIGQPETRFTFDYVACETINQEMLFRVIGLPMVENCMSGYNSCMFGYGQTGSGKTFTMLGEIGEMEIRSSPDRGMTPRIFEFLFARIRAEEDSRTDEKLKYNCKCSFLEIYNEQITDLLDPSSTNLLLREDVHKGVYVENLSEFEVEAVNDVLKLLIQGAANRKVATTNMNRESSRSHSVFTCVIESRWEKDSTTNLRFSRLNLVDLAGSERQKTSGAEGERLKEAANINKSLSTLGHVIMILADVAHGKQRHIPYRDSRLTFLLQDSLGGNSKTVIMANVSPSICSSNETLSTLKFAQRAKLIQNNAVVNEDASGDILALQHQIHLLKEELSVLKCQNLSRSLSFRRTILEDSDHEPCHVSSSEKFYAMVQMNADKLWENESSGCLKSLETTLVGALRREKMADMTIKQLEAEIEQLNSLVHQREEDVRFSKMMLRFWEDKIHRMETLLDGQVPIDTYLAEENTALSEEIQLLRTRVDKNHEFAHFGLENIRLLDKIRRFQDFYEGGERELLLSEVSELRNQLVLLLEAKPEQDQYPRADTARQEAAHLQSASSIRDNEFMDMELKRTCQELENCRRNLKSCLETNERLTRDINNLCIQLNNIQSSSDDQHVNIEPQSMEFCLASSQRNIRVQAMRVEWKPEISMKHAEEILNLQLELDILKIILGEEKSAHAEAEERATQVNCELKVANETIFQITQYNEDLKNELKDARSIIEALESQNMTSLNELENLRENNIKYTELLKKKEQEISILRKQLDGKLSFANEDPKGHLLRNSNFENTHLQLKLKRVQASLEKACSLNLRYQSDLASQTSIEQEMEEVRRQVEVETAEVIVCLQEELMALQQQVDSSNRNELLAKQSLAALETETKELHEKLCLVTQDNERLGELVKDKERDIKLLTDEWERLACEVADVLADGNAALDDASGQVAFISDSFPHKSWISEQLGRMIESISKRDASIIELQNCLEDAQNVRCDMEQKLRSLRGATLAITEVQQQETSKKEKEILLLTSKISEKDAIIVDLESRINICEEQIRKAEICATVAFMTVSRLSETNRAHFQPMDNVKVLFNESTGKSFQKGELPQDHISLYAVGVKQIQAVKLQLEQSKEHDAQLKHYQEGERTEALDYKQKKEENVALSRIAVHLLKAKRMINEIKVGVYTLHSCMSEFSEHICSSAEVHNSGNDSVESADYNHEDLMEIKSLQNVLYNKHHNVQMVPSDSIENPVGNNVVASEGSRLSEGTFGRETTIFLVRKEIDYALDSLQEVQDQMVKLLSEKEEMKKSEIQSQNNIEHLSDELLQLKSDIIAKEQQFEFRLLELEHKLQTVEGNAIASNEVSKSESEQATIGPTDNAISSGGSCR